MKILLFALVTGASLLFSSTLVLANVCYPTISMEKLIKERFKQDLVAVGTANNNRILGLYASTITRKWTIVIFNADGIACAIAVGTDIDFLDKKVPTLGT